MEKKIKIHVFHTGEVGVDPAVPFRDVSRNPIAYTGLFRSKKRRILLPVSAYLIEHPKGLVLIDTGWHRDVRIDQIKHMSWKLNFASKARLPEGEAIDEQFGKLGIKPRDLDYVFLTHLDVDHASGLELVKEAKHIMTSKEELEAAQKGDIRYSDRFWNGVNLEPFKMKASSYGPFGRSYDVFGDESVLLIDVAGHTKGTSLVMVQNQGQFVLLTGDTGYAEESWEELRLPGPVDDKEKMRKTLKWVQEMSKKEGCVEVLATHDPEVIPHVIEL